MVKHEDRKKDFRIIYEELFRDFRIYRKKIAKALKIDDHTASNRLKEAFEEVYISFPQLRKRSYANLKEYVYIVRSENALQLLMEYIENNNIVFHCVMVGYANLWIVSKEPIDIEGIILVEGLRSDYYVAYAPNHSWKKAIEKMWKMIENFDPSQYIPKGIIKTHWDETLDWWDPEFETLYREFKYNGRKKYQPIMDEHHINSRKIQEFLENANICCTVFSRYFPDSIFSYDPTLFIFETDYEDFIIDLFSELPTSSCFFKVGDFLLIYAHTQKSIMRKPSLTMSDISEMHIPLMMEELVSRGIIKKREYSIIRYGWGKDL